MLIVAIWLAAAPMDPPQLMDRARTAYAGLKYEKVARLAEQVLAHTETTSEQRMEAHQLLGFAQVIIGYPVEAEKQFRFLLRGNPDFEIPANTSPKIVAVFRKVQAEEREIREQARALERRRMIAELQLLSELPTRTQGGTPLLFDVRLRDPRGVVAEVSVDYRKVGEAAFSSLALERTETGSWRGQLSADWTASESGFMLEYGIVTRDATRLPLLRLPNVEMTVAAGQVEETPFYQRGWFWAVAAGGLVVLSVVGWVAYDKATELPKSSLGTAALD